ncbi:MAG: hypothetical protein QF441_15025 [Bacteriovoracaceae bacterium]|jgi:hypothetical protein|nr:hypothetical protein [Halobacteriovoraceae bacterium]MDP7321918.1 hypothetical protein [Bacteriovoracaceae bacterium]
MKKILLTILFSTAIQISHAGAIENQIEECYNNAKCVNVTLIKQIKRLAPRHIKKEIKKLERNMKELCYNEEVSCQGQYILEAMNKAFHVYQPTKYLPKTAIAAQRAMGQLRVGDTCRTSTTYLSGIDVIILSYPTRIAPLGYITNEVGKKRILAKVPKGTQTEIHGILLDDCLFNFFPDLK